MSFPAKGVIAPHAAFALVLGANIGAALVPLLESPAGGDPVAKRLPVGNLLNRLTGCMIGLVALDWAGPLLVAIEPDPARAVADFHSLFNHGSAVPARARHVRASPGSHVAGASDTSGPVAPDLS